MSEPPLPDRRNAEIWVHVGGELKRRGEAKVSVFDSSVQGGDAVWEGLRVYDGRIADLEAHLDRMFDSAHALAFASLPSREEIKAAIFQTLKANGMRDGAHIRLTLTRGMTPDPTGSCRPEAALGCGPIGAGAQRLPRPALYVTIVA